MPMTKAEKFALDTALRAAAVNRALRWSDSAPVRDLPIPTGVDSTSGWDFNPHNARRPYGGCSIEQGVYQAWSEFDRHGEGPARPSGRYGGGSQGGRALYSTRALALRGLRAAIEAEAAGLLADIDAEIGKEEAVRWRPASDRPEEGIEVLVWLASGLRSVATWLGEASGWWIDRMGQIEAGAGDVLFWLPLGPGPVPK